MSTEQRWHPMSDEPEDMTEAWLAIEGEALAGQGVWEDDLRTWMCEERFLPAERVTHWWPIERPKPPTCGDPPCGTTGRDLPEHLKSDRPPLRSSLKLRSEIKEAFDSRWEHNEPGARFLADRDGGEPEP